MELVAENLWVQIEELGMSRKENREARKTYLSHLLYLIPFTFYDFFKIFDHHLT